MARIEMVIEGEIELERPISEKYKAMLFNLLNDWKKHRLKDNLRAICRLGEEAAGDLEWNFPCLS